MDMTSAVKSDVFRPMITTVIPGAVAIAPFVLHAAYHFPEVRALWHSYSVLASALLLFAVLAAGLILENLGAIVEVLAWDQRIEEETQSQQKDWYEYLRLAPSPEPIAQRYLRTVTLKLKFELSFGLALIAFWIGILWFDTEFFLLSNRGVISFSAITLALAAYMLWESGVSARILADVRHLMVHGTKCSIDRTRAEPEQVARDFDRVLKLSSVLALSFWVAITAVVIYRIISLGAFAGLSSATLALLFGLALGRTSRINLAGLRRGLAIRIAVASFLAVVLTGIRLFDRGPHLVGILAYLGLAIICIAFTRLSFRLPARAPSDPAPVA